MAWLFFVVTLAFGGLYLWRSVRRRKRRLGFMQGRVDDTFFHPLDDEELKDWN